MPNQQLQLVAATEPEQIAGLVERVTFHNDATGFCVLRLKARGHRELVTVVGTLPEVRAGEWLEAQGRWIVNKEYGQQFQAEVLRTMPPTTVEGIEKYLARDIPGIGFKPADVIAESVGIAKQSDLRARAGVEYVLLQLTEEGHCGYGREELVALTVQLLEIPDEIIQMAVEYLLQEKRIVARTLDTDAGPVPAVFLASLDLAERNLAASLIARQAGRHPCPQIDMEKAIAWVEGKTGLQLGAQQRQAIELACRSGQSQSQWGMIVRG